MPVVPGRYADNQHDENRRQPDYRIKGDMQLVGAKACSCRWLIKEERSKQYLSISVGFNFSDMLGFASRVARSRPSQKILLSQRKAASVSSRVSVDVQHSIAETKK